jgi:sialate O-acetylesterase
MAKLPPLKVGGPYTLTISGPSSVTLKNVMVGDVWVCSGQSNMEMGIAGVNDAEKEIASADNPNIRLFTVAKTISLEPKNTVTVRDSDLMGEWSVCSPKTVATGGWGGFSAVAYFFGRHLQKELGVPIGLIHTSWGGTVAEAWTSLEALNTHPDFRSAAAQIQEMRTALASGKDDFDKRMADWWARSDPGSAAGRNWADPGAATTGWRTMELPKAWEDGGLANFDGIVWFRREVEVSADDAGKAAVLHLGPIDDRDTTWVNGVKVGETGIYNASRDYRIPAGTLKAGKNVIAVRVLDTGGAGGINGTPEQLSLEIGNTKTSLAGPWSFQPSSPLSRLAAVPERVDNNPNFPTVLYNGMISPLLQFGIKGAIWYQGESNAGRAYQYRTLLPTMIRDWRSRWGVGEFPFFIVQLANFMQTDPEPKDDAWPELREAQYLTTQAVPNAGLAVTIDIGDAADIHPKDKQDVGKRLALAALGIAYKKPIEYSGPVYKSMKVEGDKVQLQFSHLGGGLEARGGELKGFAIAGADRKFVWADARIDGDSVVVSSPQVKQPVAVRYAWANNPVCNLYNKTDLPAVPFRTDTWPGVTANNH